MDAGLLEDLLRGVGVGGEVEEQHGKLRDAAGGEVEGVLAGDEQNAVVGRDLGVGNADELFEVRNIGAGSGEAFELRERRVGDCAVEMVVT